MSGQAGNLDRNQEAGHVQVYNDYWWPTSIGGVS
jgi:hypothetical protein